MIHSDAKIYIADNNEYSIKEEEEKEDYNENKTMELSEDLKEEQLFEEVENEKNEADTLKEKLEEMKTKKESKRKSKKMIEEEKLKLQAKVNQIDLVPYYAVDYTKNELVLIIGGETHGVSQNSYKLVKSREGSRVNIPLNNGVDSLNSGMAMGIIAFEIKRQILKALNDCK